MNYSLDFTLETSRCILRAPSLDDIPVIFAASQVEGFNDGMIWDPPNNEEEMVPFYEALIAAWKEGSVYCFSIVCKKSGEFLGRVAIHRNEDAQDGIWDLGFFTIPQHQGNDYMTEAVKTMISFGFTKLEAHKIVAAHAVWNKASERVLQKNGMTHIEHIPRGFKKKGEWVEENLLGMTKVEWKQLNAVNLE